MTSPCDKLVQFDTVAMSSSMATLYSALQFINQENYASVKTGAAANVPGYFDGSYDQFKTQRNKLSSLFQSSGFTSLSSDYYRHSLSPAGAEAYARCVAEQSGLPISAWIAQRTDDRLILSVRAGIVGTTVNFEIVGAQPQSGGKKVTLPPGADPDTRDNYELNGGGSTGFIFEHDKRKSFLIVINATVKELKGAQSSTTVYLPAVREFEIRKEVRAITGTCMVAAGCQGNTSLCRLTSICTLMAPDGFHLDPASLQKVSEIMVGPYGVNQYRVGWANAEVGGVIRSMIGTPDPSSIDGANGDTQGRLDITYTVNAIREYIVELP